MKIDENQLITWSKQGAIVASTNTYQSVKTCIDEINWNNDVSYEIYLQGSYKSSTNIRGDSDVDVVIEFKSMFYSNKNDLPPEQIQEFNEYYSEGKYELQSLKDAVIEHLKYYYGENYINVNNKSIKILANSGRLNCDVICCAEYRKYQNFNRLNPNNYVNGILFKTINTNEEIINYPKQHFENGVDKNKKCDSNYKSVVRILKNMRSKLIDDNRISKTLAPSYFIECLLYNISNDIFKENKYCSIIESLLITLNNCSDEQYRKLSCQNEMLYLFGSSEQQWKLYNCKEFVKNLTNLYYER